MIKALRPANLFLALIILLSPFTAVAQQRQSASLDELKSQIAKLEEIERASDTSVDVKSINQTFLESRRADLRHLLANRITELRAYLSESRTILKAAELEKVEELLGRLELELQNLNPGAKPEGVRVLPAAFSRHEATTEPSRLRVGDTEAASVISTGVAARQACPANLNDLIKSVVLVTGAVNSSGSAQNTFEVTLNVPLSATNQPPDVLVVGTGNVQNLQIPATHVKITVQAGATATVLTPSPPITTLSGTGRDTLLINLLSPIPPAATKATITLSDLAFECPSAAAPTLIGATSLTGNITPNDTLLASDIAALNEANKAASAKRSNDKNFRMGFTTVKGDTGGAEGAADISFSKRLFGGGPKTGTLFDYFDQADIAFALKKSTAEDVDPRHLTIGFNVRKSFLVDSRLRIPDAGTMTRSEAQRRVKSKGFFRVLMIKQGLNLEGEAFDFKTTNFVSDTHFELASIAKKLGSGFYNLNIFAGPEIGRNLAKPDAATTTGTTPAQLAAADWITRLKAGGEFTLRLLPSAMGDNWGVEVNLGYVNRHLFSSEVFTQETMEDGETIRKLVTVGKGNRAWRQADLKVYLFGNESARYGVKLSYHNGQLPPAFTPTKGFQFGLVIESPDDTQGGEAANKP